MDGGYYGFEHNSEDKNDDGISIAVTLGGIIDKNQDNHINQKLLSPMVKTHE